MDKFAVSDIGKSMRNFRKRGPEQIRPAVEAFAELCLATRPGDHFFKRVGKSNE